MDSPQQADDLDEAPGKDVQDTFEALPATIRDHGVRLPQVHVGWGLAEPRIILGSASLAADHQPCRAMECEDR